MNILGLRVDLGNLLHAAPDHYGVLGWVVALPLLGAVINGLYGKRLGREGVYIAGIASVAGSFLLSLVAFAALLKSGHAPSGGGAEAAEHVRRVVSCVPSLFGRPWEWFSAPTGPSTSEMLSVRYVLDDLSAVMLLVVTGIGTLIHVYSAGYMSHDHGYARFFAYLNLFIFSMLNLILGDSMVLMFLGWEGVGLCSYLLIGFWYERSDYAFAGRKAFIVNRIGDAGFLLGMTILAWKGGSYRFDVLREHVTANPAFLQALAEPTNLGGFLADVVPGLGRSAWLVAHLERMNPTWGGLACLLLFVGCCGKSAQLPLFVWLPDAMAGPTPVSALIHAATMVTAGIYLLCRLSFVFVLFPTVLNIVALTGAATALFAATIAVTQVELKKVLAYSTVSQLGFMFMGCGSGAFSAGFFHVFTHAFFKACLFLGAGAVMHACHEKQDLRELGGLKKYLPSTHLSFAVATLAIIGTPLTSGFFSKDEILFRALANPMAPRVGKIVYFTGVAAATLTSFYMCRLYIKAFLGPEPAFLKELAGVGGAPTSSHSDAHGEGHAHGEDHDHGHGHGEAGPPSEDRWDMKVMTAVLLVLAAGSLLVGVLGLPSIWTHKEGILPRFLEHAVVDVLTANRHLELNHRVAWPAMVGGLGAWATGLGLAYYVYIQEKGEPAQRLAERAKVLYQLVYDKWRVDELYDAVIVRPFRAFANFAALFDKHFVDGLVNLTGFVAVSSGRVLRLAHTGSIQVYGMLVSVGLVAMVSWAVLLPRAQVTQRTEGGSTVLEAVGGPGYTYRWAFYAPREDQPPGRQCHRAAALEALSAPSMAQVEATAETRTQQQFTAPRCAALEAHNAFGKVTVVTALVQGGAGGAPPEGGAGAPPTPAPSAPGTRAP
ncbi:MAG: NADH-quinone oxidoreductase subunit L [Deltaproteobacteria bacterium]|nr:NADH-quinone oxidoreductase subunit L [Deltaproteobacteria bacterium]